MASADSSPPTSPPVGPQDTGYESGGDARTRWRNWFTLLLGGMTDEGKMQYRHDRDLRFETKDCARCEKWRDFSLNYSPTVRFLADHLQKLGGELNRDNVQCRRCDNQMAGAFDPQYGILLCANHLNSRGHTEETIAHEMIHAWDHLRYKVDWADNLRHAACSEIRASSLSGECRWLREFWTRGQFRLARQHQTCVKRRAVISVQARPFCKDREHAERVVDEVWESCFKDTRPFDEIYR